MNKKRRQVKVVGFAPRPHQLIAVIQQLAANSSNVMYREHALERMEERDITTLDVLRVLRVGSIVGDIEAGRYPGEWKCKVVEHRKKARDIGVATIIVKNRRLLVKTVEWEDL